MTEVLSPEINAVILLGHAPSFPAQECGSQPGNSLYLVTQYWVRCVLVSCQIINLWREDCVLVLSFLSDPQAPPALFPMCCPLHFHQCCALHSRELHGSLQ